MICKIVKHFPNASNWNVGDTVDITNPAVLLQQGFVEEVKPGVVVEEKAIDGDYVVHTFKLANTGTAKKPRKSIKEIIKKITKK